MTVTLALLTAPARAHDVPTVFSTYCEGAQYGATTAGDVLVVVALALLAGQSGPESARALRWALPAAWLSGGLVGLTWPASGVPRAALILSFALVGLLVALDRKLYVPVVVALATVAGLAHGYFQGGVLSGGGLTWPALLGATTVVLVLATLISAVATRAKAPWQRIVVRVAGSWIVAIGLLMLGWLARVPGHH